MKKKGISFIKYLFSYILIFLFSGIVYCTIEIIYRGYTHWTMFLCAGVCGIGLALINDYGYKFETDFRIQVIIGAAQCTFAEFIVGEIFNRNYEIWDYRGLIGTIHCLDDQVNLLFIMAWIVITIVGIPLLDFIEWKLGIEEKPYYRIGKKHYYLWR